MKNKLAMLLGAVVLGMSVSIATACPDHEAEGKGTTATTVAHDGKAPCAGAKVAGKPCGGGSSAPCHTKSAGSATVVVDERVESVMAKLPKMMFRVGDETTCCEKSAVAMAEKSGKPLQYVVGDEVVSDHCAAEVKLAAALEKELDTLAAIRFAVGDETVGCPVTAKEIAKKKSASMAYRVAGVDFQDETNADKAVKLVTEALDTVKMTYKVDGESFCCDKMAGMKVKETGKPLTYVIGGEETSCEKHARLLLMQAKARAAVSAALNASAT